jgi:glyoxylase-like metal-dependent hydrolase (beta-lactamase superfamily II)
MWREMAPGIYSIREKSYRFGQPPINVYYIPDSKGGGLLFDAGYAMPRSFNDFISGFRSLATHLKQTGQIADFTKFRDLVTTILISHEHHDHSSGIPLLQQYFSRAQVVASRITAKLLMNHDIMWRNPGEMMQQLLMKLFYRIIHVPYSILVDRFVQGNEIINAGSYHFMVLLAPGHSPGQILLHDLSSGILLTSDLVLEKVSTWLGPPHSDYQAYQDTMASIAALSVTIMLPAHGGSIKNPTHRVHELLAFRRLRERQIIRSCAGKTQTARDIAWRIYRERGIGTFLIAKGMVELVLEHLVSTGRLQRLNTGHGTRYGVIPKKR